MPKPQSPFNPDAFMKNWCADLIPSHDSANGISFRQCIIKAFNLPEDDYYEYRAQGVTTLDITQRAINGKRAHGLHDWYCDETSTPTHPTPPEILAYTSLFLPSVSLPKALNAFKNSAKAGSLQSHISTHLSSEFVNKTPSLGLLPAKKGHGKGKGEGGGREKEHKNPYLDLWVYSCRELEWAGPWAATLHTKISHHTLPIFYHHFGCIVPSYTALSIIAKLAQPAKPSIQPVLPILDVGSGNGYWTFMLRRFVGEELGGGGGGGAGQMKELEVHAVDNQISEYRTTWIADTIISDGVKFLTSGRIRIKTAQGELEERPVNGGRGCILLLVYPQATGNFTSSVLRAYKGDVIVVAGTQNGNGFTGFKGERVEDWMARERGEFELVLRVPLPSFAGKDEGLCVFRRRAG